MVPDEAVPAGSTILQSILDVQCASDEDEAAFGAMMDAPWRMRTIPTPGRSRCP
ncbi:MAG: hypothetical protein ACLR3C_10365 [Eggerthella lenta]